jgi:cyclase
LFADGIYNLSRNFRLQQVGDLDWVLKNYDFQSIARSIDELIVLDVGRSEQRAVAGLCSALRSLGRNCFMPVAAGGGVKRLADAKQLFEAGADKLVLNSAYFLDPDLVREVAKIYGSQSIVASLDYRREKDGTRRVYFSHGSQMSAFSLQQAVAYVQDVGAGEIYMTSIDHDGTGHGFDMEGLALVAPSCPVPIIASGGAGNHLHFSEALKSGLVTAVSTANLFNFMADGLADARSSLVVDGIDFSVWHFPEDSQSAW